MNLICDTCGSQIDKNREGIVTFKTKTKGKIILKDFKLVHKGRCDIREKEDSCLNSWVAMRELTLKNILKNLDNYGPEIPIEGRSLVRVLAQFYEDKEN